MRPYYEDESVALYLGDCLDVMPGLVPDQSCHAIIADLPYGTTRCKWDSVIPLEPLWEQYRRVLKPNGVIALTASQPFTSALVMSNPVWFRHEWVWVKNRGSNFANTVREPMKEHEAVLIFSPGKWTYNKQMQERTGGGASRVQYGFESNAPERTEVYNDFNYKRPASLGALRVPSSWQKFNCEVGLHPTQKPLPLMEYLIRTYTNEGDMVLDNTAGSGTTLLAARNLGRRAVGIEIDESSCEIIAIRLSQSGLELGVA